MLITIFDTETTGLEEPMGCDISCQPHMVEIAAVQINHNFKVKQEYIQLVKPPVSIPYHTTKVHGYTDYDVRKAPPFKKIVKPLAKVFQGSEVMVAHNCVFDWGMLVTELTRCGKLKKFPMPRVRFCTVEQSFHMFGYRPKLLELYTHLTGKKEIKKQHTAKADTDALLKIYKELMKP